MARKITFQTGERAGTSVSVPDDYVQSGTNAPVSGNDQEEKQLRETADADVASNAGKQAQSTDHQNSY